MTSLIFIGTRRGLVTVEQTESEWREVNRSLINDSLTSVTAVEDVLLAGTTAGLFRSEDRGRTWRLAETGLTIRHIRRLSGHLQEKGWVLAGTEPAAIFVSEDQGQSWRECPEVAAFREAHGWSLPYSPRAGCVRDFACRGNRVYAAVEEGGLLRSDDKGLTWGLVEGSSGDPDERPGPSALHPDVHAVVVHPASPDLVFAATGGGLYRSGDGGDRWECLYRCYCRAVWPDPADPDHLWLGPAASVDVGGRIEESVDGGRTWKPATSEVAFPWSDYMVERFTLVDYSLVAILSNGQLLAAPAVAASAWKPILPDIGPATTMTTL